MTTPFSIEADVLQCGYAVGYFDERVIVNWADSQIMATENPSAELLALSTIVLDQTSSIDVLKLLRSFGPANHEMSIQNKIGFIGLQLSKSSITVPIAFNELWALRDEPGITEEELSHIYVLDDHYDNATNRVYGSIQDVEQEIRDFVTSYAERLAEQYPHLISPPEHE